MPQGKSAEANNLREQNNEVQLKIKELEHNISKHRKDSQEAADKVKEHSSHASVSLKYRNTSMSLVSPSIR